jgi:hypothetical protein
MDTEESDVHLGCDHSRSGKTVGPEVGEQIPCILADGGIGHGIPSILVRGGLQGELRKSHPGYQSSILPLDQ